MPEREALFSQLRNGRRSVVAMLRSMVGFSLKAWPLVAAGAAGVIALGILQVDDTPVDALPEFGPTIVEVQTEALGLSAAEVEQLITVPLEQDLLVGVAFLDEIESVSLPGSPRWS